VTTTCGQSARGALGAVLACGLLKRMQERCRLSAAPFLCVRAVAIVLVCVAVPASLTCVLFHADAGGAY
jgi:hypothetical protein